MIDAFINICSSGEIWEIIIKVLLGLALSGVTALMGTLIVKIVTKSKESKIYKYASTLVEAAEQKFPNEGTKMGPQKMDYVMSQLCIRFPSIKDNRYLYNVVEQAVFKFNDDRQQQKMIAEFEAKYGEGSYKLAQEQVGKSGTDVQTVTTTTTTSTTTTNNVQNKSTTNSGGGLKSF